MRRHNHAVSRGPHTEDVVVRELTPEDARAVTSWRYGGPWSVYDGNEDELISAELGYHAIVERPSGAFLGFFCLGADASVPGLVEEPRTLDLGVGLDPAIVGQGRGAAIVLPVLDWVAHRSDAHHLRAVVQSWNERSLRFCRALGFEAVGHHLVSQAGAIVDYVVLNRPMPRRAAPSATRAP
jgi:[ribosomal protein S18]-alanine N-acetyltransferase